MKWILPICNFGGIITFNCRNGKSSDGQYREAKIIEAYVNRALVCSNQENGSTSRLYENGGVKVVSQLLSFSCRNSSNPR